MEEKSILFPNFIKFSQLYQSECICKVHSAFVYKNENKLEE